MRCRWRRRAHLETAKSTFAPFGVFGASEETTKDVGGAREAVVGHRLFARGFARWWTRVAESRTHGVLD